MSVNNIKAEKNDKILEELEAGLEDQEVQEAEEDTVEEESAPSKEESETEEEAQPAEPEEEDESQSPDEEEQDEDEEVEADSDTPAGFTEKEWQALSEKTRNQMVKLREKARQVSDSEENVRDSLAEDVYAPLKEVAQDIKDEAYQPKSPLPWEDSPSVKAGQKAASLISDIKYAESTYPELNPDSSDYNDKLTGEILQDFRKMSKADPDYSLKELVDRRMIAIREAKEEARKSVEKKATIKKQKAKEAIPSNVSPSRKKPSIEDKIKSAKSVDELDKLEKELGTSKRYK